MIVTISETMRQLSLFIIIVLISMAVPMSGCIGAGSPSEERNALYVKEFTDATTCFDGANSHYQQGLNYYNRKGYNDAAREMRQAMQGYDEARKGYDRMLSYADTDDRKKYATALKLEAENCVYASSAFCDAYAAFASNEITKGNTHMNNANQYMAQAKKNYDIALAYEGMAIGDSR